MATASSSFQAVMTGTPEQRVEALRQFLGYPLKQRDPEKNLFWYLRPGVDEDTASETRPVAVGFYSELNDGSDPEIKAWVATNGSEVSQHFFDWFDATNQPVMYLLLPEAQQSGRVVLVLPSESRQWRHRQVLTYEWDSSALLTPLGRLQQNELELMQKVEDRPMFSVPLVEWAFYRPIATAKELAQELARVSREMEQIIAAYNEATLNEYLKNLFNSFKRELLSNLKVSSTNQKDYSFADIYAQTIAYGLFTARVFSHVRNPKADFNRQDAWDKLPETNPFLRQLFQGISEQPVEVLGDELADKISEVFSILRAAKMDAILSDFRKKMNREDIVIRFYEDFLDAYESEMKKRRGVYYTPEPVVSYMVRSVDILLKEKFDKPLGLADPEVMILDPACGTGTFLLWIFRLIHQRFEENPEALTEGLEDKSWSGYVQERLLPRIFGFELLMAPYAICHLKLGLFLEETGYQFDSGKRLSVYLTNSLDEAQRKSDLLFKEFIAEESDQAALVKREKPIMAVIGNPPYSGHSANNSPWISKLLRDYYQVDGQPLGERNPKWLQDDYVKFIRFGQWRIDQSKEGILAFITNHGYLENPTFRGMRRSLEQSFNQIKVIDLHGNTKKKEVSPDGSKDENVFDIQQGVAIGLLMKNQESKTEMLPNRGVDHAHLYGTRGSKYNWLMNNAVSSTEWQPLQFNSPFYLLIPQDTDLLSEYQKGWKVTEIFGTGNQKIDGGKRYGLGICTHNDKLFVGWTEEEVESRVKMLADEGVSDDFLLSNLPIKESPYWRTKRERVKVRQSRWKENIIPIYYRPFDWRTIYYEPALMEIGRGGASRHVMRHAKKNSLNLLTSRGYEVERFEHVLVCDTLTVHHSATRKEGCYLFPLYVYPGEEILENPDQDGLLDVNFSPNFKQLINDRIGVNKSPESIFGYIYGILHIPSYRNRYAEFLKADFPRIPFTSNPQLFQSLANHGEALINLHLMKSPALENLITESTPAIPSTPTTKSLSINVATASLGSPKKFGNSTLVVTRSATNGSKIAKAVP
jgi:type I restriction-modification system DNA methylase subunit